MKLNLLVVEDDLDVRDSIVSSLDEQEMQIVTADDGLNAIEILNQNKEIHAILSDINMPRMNGLDMILAIRKSGSQIPIVFLTGFADRDNTLKALRAGALDFLDKPFDIAYLNKVVSRALKIGQKMKQLDDILNQSNRDDSAEKFRVAQREIELMKLDNEISRSELKKAK